MGVYVRCTSVQGARPAPVPPTAQRESPAAPGRRAEQPSVVGREQAGLCSLPRTTSSAPKYIVPAYAASARNTTPPPVAPVGNAQLQAAAAVGSEQGAH
jgi:hypothetical protein